MGVSIGATNSKYSFDMGYSGFFNLRKNIALALDKEFGENYANLANCHSEEDYEAHDKIANDLIEKKHLDVDVVGFLYQEDSEGKIDYTICRKIYYIIKDVDFSGKSFRYAAYAHNDYEEFKAFLKECYSHRRQMRWS